MIMPQLIINTYVSLMYELKKKIGKIFTSKSVGTGPSSYEKKNLPGRGLTKVEKHCSIDLTKFYKKKLLIIIDECFIRRGPIATCVFFYLFYHFIPLVTSFLTLKY